MAGKEMLRRLLPGRCRVSWDWKQRRRSTCTTERNTWATRRTSRGMNIREQLAPRRRDKKEVVAVLAPNPYQRPSTETSYYAFMESPSEVTSRSMMSLSSQGSVRHTGRTGHGSAVSGSAAPRRLQQGSRDPTGIAGGRPRSAPPTQKPDNPVRRGVPHKVLHRLIARPPTPVSVAVEGKSTEAKGSTTAKPTVRPWR